VCFTDTLYDVDGERAIRSGNKATSRSPSRKSPRKRRARRHKVPPPFGDSTERARRRGWQRSHRPAFSRKSALEEGAGIDILPSFSPVDGVLLYIEGRQLDDRERNVSGQHIDEYVCSSVGIPGVREAVQAAVTAAGIVSDVRISAPSLRATGSRLDKRAESNDKLEPLMYGTRSGPVIPRALGRTALTSRSEGNLSSMASGGSQGSGVGSECDQGAAGTGVWVEMAAGCVWDGSCIVTSALGVRLR
jgi:hypothetical protein